MVGKLTISEVDEQNLEALAAQGIADQVLLAAVTIRTPLSDVAQLRTKWDHSPNTKGVRCIWVALRHGIQAVNGLL